MTVTRLRSRARSRPLNRAVTFFDPAVFTPTHAREVLRTKCAAWVQDLGLVVEECSVLGARLRLPYSPRVARAGGTICSQALTACADAAMTIAVAALFGDVRNLVAVRQTISFVRAISIEDVIIVATVPRLGGEMIEGDVTFHADGDDAIAARATATWMAVPSAKSAQASSVKPTLLRRRADAS
jgi:acyl-coenzyme A thioesterase PaaI-like protein